MTNRRFHPAWIVLGAVTVCLLASTGLRATFARLHQADGSRDRLVAAARCPIAAAISLLLLGAIGPFAGRLADRWGPRRIIVASMALLGVGGVALAFVQSLWQLYVTAGVLMALGAGGAALTHGLVRRRPVVRTRIAARRSASPPAACRPAS